LLTYYLFINYLLIISKPDANVRRRKGTDKKSRIILFAPNSKTRLPVNFITGNYTRPIEELKKFIMNKRDTKAYYELQIAYLNVHYCGECIYIIQSLWLINATSLLCI